MVLDGRSYHLDENVLEQIKRRRNEIIELTDAKRKKNDVEYLQSCFLADKIIEKYKGVDVTEWKRKEDIISVLKPLKVSGDIGMPSNRAGVEERYHEWQNRRRRIVDDDDEVMQLFDKWKQDQK